MRKHFVVQFTTRLYGLSALEPGLQIAGDVILHYDTYLDDVSGLANLAVTATTPASIVITHNPVLPTCNAEAAIAARPRLGRHRVDRGQRHRPHARTERV